MDIQKEFSTAKDIASQWGVTVRMVSFYCTHGLIPGAVKMGMIWLIPKTAEKPVDHRRKGTKN
ncbi:MAG: DNA-binding protein [Sphaerochaetaceae bacterium]|jgi:hypothetical protein|nr:DNA-binding protein [Sphaerochaetaceae bacterium]MDD4397494.1 DNA-binding protein [Sphaerochaetaceae bacterium]